MSVPENKVRRVRGVWEGGRVEGKRKERRKMKEKRKKEQENKLNRKTDI